MRKGVIKRDKTKQNKTKQNKTKQNKTKQNKTKRKREGRGSGNRRFPEFPEFPELKVRICQPSNRSPFYITDWIRLCRQSGYYVFHKIIY